MKTDWAENEINILCKAADAYDDGYGSAEYAKECYFAAYDAYLLLMNQGHSGCSIGFTMKVLNKLVDGKPLTPIENTDDMWEPGFESEEYGYKSFNCKRYPSLYKKVYNDGKVVYSDINRWRCYDKGSNVPYSSGQVNCVLDEMFPIKFPYSPHTWRVNCETFLLNKSLGDFDHKAIFNVVEPDGTKWEVAKFYQEFPKGWEEISYKSYASNKRISQGGGTGCGQS